MATEGDDAGHKAAVRRLFDEMRRRLVETGTRNRLIHVNRQSRRSNVLDVINERSDDIYALLGTSRRTMQFLATGRDKEDDSDTPRLTMRGDTGFGAERFTDARLETRLGPDGLQKRLLKLARDAKTAEEEQGVNILYLALGFLSWFEDNSSSVKREAPLILLPVELVRNARTSSYDIRLRDDDIVTNLPLQERLKGDFGLRLPEIEIDETWTPSRYFDAVDEVVASRPRWSIDRDGMQLGFFSFAKLLMFRDLDPGNWPENALEDHALTRGLLYESFEPEEPMFGRDDRLDPLLPPAKMFHVVDADASQAKVIEEVRSGRNLVVQGPPGTGKSQTITNIIAAAVREGRRVLFVAEKMAALSVVHQRLVNSGLRDVCLELHSKTANKKAVLAELAQTLNAAQAIPAMPGEPVELEAARDELNRIDAALHRSLDANGETPFSALAQQVRFAGAGAPPPVLRVEGVEAIGKTRAAELAAAVRDYAGALSGIGPLPDHPFYGTRTLTLQPADVSRLKGRLETAADAARRAGETVEAALGTLAITMPATAATAALLRARLGALAGPPGVADSVLIRLLQSGDKQRLRETLAIGADWRRARDAAEAVFLEQAWATDAGSWRAFLLAGASSFFARWGKGYRGTSRQLAALLRDVLPKKAADRIERLDVLLTVKALRESWRQDESWAAAALAEAWRGERTDFRALLAALDWAVQASDGPVPIDAAALTALSRDAAAVDALMSRLDAVRETGVPTVAGAVATLDLDLEPLFGAAAIEACVFPEIEPRLRGMAAAEARYDEWARLCLLREAVRQGGLDGLLPGIDGGRTSGEAAATEFLYARAEAIWNRALAGEPLLAALRNLDRHAAVKLFADLEKSRRVDAVKAILAHHLKQVPQGARGTMATVRGELARRRAHMPLRKFFSAAGEAIQRIKPVLLMSPISVAQYLKPGAAKFNLLVIDEASQVRPEDALGAIARASQIVVVGDQKQLPPSAFFDRLASNGGEGDDEEDEEAAAVLDGGARVAEMESILTLCEARGLGGRMLEWHYRSRDPSLIRVSNAEFYKSGLILPPSPLQNDPAYGLIFTRVAGAYDRGGKRDNRIEGEAIVRRVTEHARETPDVSLGIVTFSSAQRNLISELLEFARREDATLDEFLRESAAEEVFVKNIENVQGDERDVILVSVGYGPTQAGMRLTNMNFGPVNVDGGERRLNVLFTRARLRCEVFASFDPGDIDLSKVSKAGPRVLKRFLEFARSGKIDEPAPAADGPDTDFERDVADAIAAIGYPVDHQVGSAGFLIDLGVQHPDRPGSYILAVECDGATYHSAIWARERDRLRQDVLEHLGWRFHRVWSTDWFYRRPAEIERLRLALQAAKMASTAGSLPDAAKDRRPAVPEPAPAAAIAIPLAESVDRAMPAYVKARLPTAYGRDLHTLGSNAMADLAAAVVEAEGPVHQDEIARRIAASFGKERAGGKTVAAVVYGLRYAARRPDSQLRSGDAFWWTAEQARTPVVRDRSTEAGPLCKAAYIAMSEIEAALRLADEDNVGGSDQDIIRAAARLFGFRRVGPDLQQRLASGLALLEREPV